MNQRISRIEARSGWVEGAGLLASQDCRLRLCIYELLSQLYSAPRFLLREDIIKSNWCLSHAPHSIGCKR